MARTTKKKKSAPKRTLRQHLRRFFWRSLSVAFMLAVALTLLFAAFNPPRTPYMISEAMRLDGIKHELEGSKLDVAEKLIDVPRLCVNQDSLQQGS